LLEQIHHPIPIACGNRILELCKVNAAVAIPSLGLKSYSQAMESSSKKSEDDGQCESDDDDDRDQEPDTDSMTAFERSNALRSHRIRFEDAINPNAERVFVVQPQDVVLGRGKRLQDLAGNARMRSIVHKYSNLYHTLKRADKRLLVETVYQEIVQNGARFLLKGPIDEQHHYYLVVGKEIALQKVSNIMRSKKPGVQQTSGRDSNGEIAPLAPCPDPVSQQSMVDSSSGRMMSTVLNNNIPAMARMSQQVAFGNEVARLPMNPLRSPTRPDPVSQQSMVDSSSGRMMSTVLNNNIPAMARMSQQVAFGNEVARLPMNPLRSPLDPLASLPVRSMYRQPTSSIITPSSEQMNNMAMMANLMERDRIIRDAVTIQRLNALQESRTAAAAAALYSQASILNGVLLNRDVVYPPLVTSQQSPAPQFPTPNTKPAAAQKEDKDQDERRSK